MAAGGGSSGSSSSSSSGAAPSRRSDGEALRVAKNFVFGGIAGMVARTVIAPIERVKIIYQTRVTTGVASSGEGWLSLLQRVTTEAGGGVRGVSAFWKGNSVALVRVFPYLGVQLTANDYFKQVMALAGDGRLGGVVLSKEVQHFCAGGGAGMLAVFVTYPLDLARARMALLMEQGVAQVPSMWGTMKQVYVQEGSVRALFAGAGISMTGAAIYCGLKFATYDTSKVICKRYLLPDSDASPSILHRAASGGFAGMLSQTFVYPFDVLRRRLQTGGAEAKAKYPGTVQGLWRLYRQEGFVRGLYKGCSLNYIKTVPNTIVYLTLFDILKEKF